jgi:MFS family permease
MSYFYKDDFGMSPAAVSMANSLTAIPWIIKPFWGFISDCFPIFGYRRKPYLTIFGLVGVSAWVFMALVVNSSWMAIATMVIVQISTAFCNVIGEALVVEES